MAEIKNNFSKGKMDKDLDERLVQKGMYRDALNVQVSTSEEAGIGTLQNILGNIRVDGNLVGGGWSCVGIISDDKNDCIYYFLHHNTRDAILKHNTNDGTTENVLIDTKAGTSDAVLDFTGNIITGINVLDDTLLWTDNNSEPKKINTSRCIQGTSAFNAHTKLVVNGIVTGLDIKKENITVIKKRPKIAPKIEIIASERSDENSVNCDFSQGSKSVNDDPSDPYDGGGDGENLVGIGNIAFVRDNRIAGDYGDPVPATVSGEFVDPGYIRTVPSTMPIDYYSTNASGAFDTDPFNGIWGGSDPTSSPGPSGGHDSVDGVLRRCAYDNGGGPDIFWTDIGAAGPRIVWDNVTPLDTGDINGNYNLGTNTSNAYMKLATFHPSVTSYSGATNENFNPGDTLKIKFDFHSNDTTDRILSLAFGTYYNGHWRIPQFDPSYTSSEEHEKHFVITNGLHSYEYDFIVPNDWPGLKVRIFFYNGGSSDFNNLTDGSGNPLNNTEKIGDVGNHDATYMDNLTVEQTHVGQTQNDYYKAISELTVSDTVNVSAGDLIFCPGFAAGLHALNVTTSGGEHVIQLSSDPLPGFHPNIPAQTWPYLPYEQWEPDINIANFTPRANYTVGDNLLLSQPSTPGNLPSNFEVKGKITDVFEQIGTPGFTEYAIEIMTISNSIPTTAAGFDTPPNPNVPGLAFRTTEGVEMYAVKEIEDNRLFQDKFIRFATRWKYEDGEYSAFSPFTDVAFKASPFAYHSVKTIYNQGMENDCAEIILSNLVTPEMPKDVVQIDILYKSEDSTVIYSLDSIKPNDPVPPGESFNDWNKLTTPATSILNPDGTMSSYNMPTAYKGEYRIKSENIHAALPANQLLRPWDNVPKKAKAQEITGNRVVYGNYTQGYHMTTDSLPAASNNIAKPYLELGYKQRSIKDDDEISFVTGKKSLKTFRTYQLGVVYGDEYGRETPVFTSKNASLKIPWDSDSSSLFNGNASRSLQLSANLRGDQPAWAKYYKFFIKQNSGEYYNLSMDRVYRSEDNENLWISFPSSDINKIQKDEYLTIKKIVGQESQVEEFQKYKIIDIKNEAPDFVKNRRISVGNVGGSTAINDILYPGATTSTKIPQVGADIIQIDAAEWKSRGGVALDDQEEDMEIQFISTTGTATIESSRYRITTVESDGTKYTLYLNNAIKQSDEWVNTDSSSGVITSTLRTKVFKIVPKEGDEFDGRFFIKIISDNNAKLFLEPYIDIYNAYKNLYSFNSYYLADDQASPGADHTTGIVNSTNSFIYNSGDNETNHDITGQVKSNSLAAWNSLLQFGTGSNNPGFFIDHSYYASVQPVSNDSTGQTGALAVDVSGRFRRGHSGPSGSYYVDSIEGVIDIDGIGAYDAGGNIDSESGWGVRSWTLESRGINNAVSFPTNTMDDIYADGRYYVHISYAGLGPGKLWEKDTSSNHIPGTANQSTFGWQFINPGSFAWGIMGDSSDSTYLDQWKIQDTESRNISENLVAGTAIKFVGSEEVFTIQKSVVKRLYNHTPFRNTRTAWNGTGHENLDNSVEYYFNRWSASMTSSRGQDLAAALDDFGDTSNRRLLHILQLDKNPNDFGISFGWTSSSAQGIRIVEPAPSDGTQIVVSPAIWETEHTKDVDLNIYYEASQAIPIDYNIDNIETIAPVGSVIHCTVTGSMPTTANLNLPEETALSITKWESSISEGTLKLEIKSPGLKVNPDGSSGNEQDPATQSGFYNSKYIKIFKEDDSYITVQLADSDSVQGIDGATGGPFYITHLLVKTDGNHRLTSGLSYYDCISFGNGVESNRIRDDFNAMFIGKGPKASATLEEQYKEEHRKNGLIYSGIYNSTSSINNLNQFIAAEKITKDLNPTYGSIQKLFQRRVNLVAFCEDRVVKILGSKDALFNADGQPQLISTNKVLGNADPFVGDYGISKNPESFCKESYRAYFTDKKRGAVLRLSMDGLTPISNLGMLDYFKENLSNAETIIGSYDDRKNEFNLTLLGDANLNRGAASGDFNLDGVTVSFNEKNKGWSSFKSFIPEIGVSSSGDYYTTNTGHLYRHHSLETDRNTFYDGGIEPSIVTSILNEQPETIKSFNTLNYEGLEGWSANILTDQQVGTVNEFVEKEGKWFNYIRGGELGDERDLQAFNYQGVGISARLDEDIQLN